ncbi:acetyl-CoA hydrolase/transferase family protein [Stenoxybacter acetivorans]|uniref:acetyl-CoA hydrolase/transferase family protein n=1 Tax=Stenoxybacter acetivorans TaxID=422441 RepID=UPI00056B6BB7|nr:acetyl-CoA hydrolase/transferase family protein [Stenoxybacter acetivorans]
MSGSRILNSALRSKIMSADEAAAFIRPGDNIGMSGFTGSGSPKAVASALAKRIGAAHERGEDFRVGMLTGASTSPDVDGELFKVDGVSLRLPYQSDPECRSRINSGEAYYTDVHLSHVAQNAIWGHYGKIRVALVEVVAILEDGRLIPSTAVGNNPTWLDLADEVIIEVNSSFSTKMEGMHDIYQVALPPNRQPIPLINPADRIGDQYMRVDLNKVVAVVETNAPDRDTAFSEPDENSRMIANHILEFFQNEVKQGRMPKNLLPFQSGVGNVANAVMAGLNEGPFSNLTSYTEVLQDGMLDMIKSGTLSIASATAISLSAAAQTDFFNNIDEYRKRIILRPQEISNHPEIIRRLGIIGMNGLLEADIYGNVNSTHVLGTRMMNGLGGSGDFTRNAYLSIFMTPSTAKGGKLSCIVPMVAHVDHTEHDVQVIVTEHGLADLRGLAPRQRAKLIIEKCAAPQFRPMLEDYFARAQKEVSGQTPHLLGEAYNWHLRALRGESM